MKSKPTKICLFCDREYNNYQKPISKFCSTKCSSDYHKNPDHRQCLYCHSIYENKSNNTSIFCSRSCSIDFKRNNREFYHKFIKKAKINKIKKVCEFCQIEFLIWPYQKNRKCCSKKCSLSNSRDHIECPTCKKIFSAPKYEKRKYCSERCAMQGVKKRKSYFGLDIFDFLSAKYNIIDEYYIKYNNKRLWADIVLTDFNIVVECNGDYWHCNPQIYPPDYYHGKIKKTAKNIWQDDLIKKTAFEQLGFLYITIWENDWNSDPNFKENLILNIESKIIKYNASKI